MTPTVPHILGAIGLVFAVLSLVPPLPGHILLAVATILVSLALVVS